MVWEVMLWPSHVVALLDELEGCVVGYLEWNPFGK